MCRHANRSLVLSRGWEGSKREDVSRKSHPYVALFVVGGKDCIVISSIAYVCEHLLLCIKRRMASSSLAGSLNYRDNELNNILEDQDKVKMKSLEREHRRKVKWLSELITFKRMDLNGHVPKACEWMVSRKRVTKKFIQDLVNRSPLPCTIDYVYDNHGVAHWFDDLMMTAQSNGYYIIAPQLLRSPEDLLQDPTYQGQTSLFLKYVPDLAIDGITPVTISDLKEFIWYSISEIDPTAQEIRKSLGRIDDELTEIAKIIKRIPKQELLDDNGKPLSEADADEERQIMYEMYGKAKYEIELKFKQRQEDLEHHHQWRRTMGLDIIKVDTDANTETSTYEIRLFGTKDAKYIENYLVKKDDYLGIKLACGGLSDEDGSSYPPWCGRGSVPNGNKPPLPDYTNRLIGISGMRLLRTIHGVGTNKTLDSRSASIGSDRFGLYYGEWNIGKKNGTGIHVNDSGIFSGRYVDDYRNGYGRLDLANGTTITGQFSYTQQTPSPLVTTAFENPYRDGEPNGKNIEILFADGAIYQGEMLNGLITGVGVYQSAFGETLAGEFKNGVFDCELGKVTNQWDETFVGRWENGDLNGKGVYEDKKGNKYNGYWKDHLKHGRGYETMKNKGEYKGYFINGYKHGKGELNFIRRKKKDQNIKNQQEGSRGNSKPSSSSSSSPPPPSVAPLPSSFNTIEDQADRTSATYQYKYQGFFMSDFISNGGILMDTIKQVPYTLSRKDTSRTQELLLYKQNLEHNFKKKKRLYEKYADLELHIRLEILTKKYRIFRQQRHYLKKTMYYEDHYGKIDPLIAIKRKEIREMNLKRIILEEKNKMNSEYFKSERAIVPRLKLKTENKIRTNHLERVYERIEPLEGSRISGGGGRKAGGGGGGGGGKYDPGDIDNELIKVAVNDLEEMKERQNMMKYDRIWERAEKAYIAKRKIKNEKQGMVSVPLKLSE
jgi:hypothetical protein